MYSKKKQNSTAYKKWHAGVKCVLGFSFSSVHSTCREKSGIFVAYCLHMSAQIQYFLWSPENEQTIISLHESQSRRQMENNVCRKLEARCDSQIDRHWRCSRATWVRSWNVARRSAGVLWALRHSSTQYPATPEGRAGSSYPQLAPPCQAEAMTLSLNLNPTALPANLWPWAAQLCTKATKFF